jgi:D-arabinose 1-dehydrogenase-like Zn-dependent alcohol dehydrogenase
VQIHRTILAPPLLTAEHHPWLRAAAAPLLCAGITTYSPLAHWNAGPGTNVAVVGLGGLGHMDVRYRFVIDIATLG